MNVTLCYSIEIGRYLRVGTLPKKFVRFLSIIGVEKISILVTNILLFASIGIILTSLKSIWNLDAKELLIIDSSLQR